MVPASRWSGGRRRPAGGVVDIELAEVIAAIGDGELVSHYQPLVSFQSGRLVGVEALARWERPGSGRLFPGAFVPRLEEGRRVTDLTSWMIDRACVDLERWRSTFALPPGFTVAVNVSATELVDHRLVRLVAEALHRYQLPADGLCLELTETSTVEDLGVAHGVMRELAALGTRLALDDYGSGAATRELLLSLPFDMVKIDQSFVASLASADSLAVIADVVSLAEGRRLDVVAEGIETPEQFAALRTLGCRRGQGFGLGRPAPADVVLDAWMPGLAGI